ncbi:MAG: hypothetical protein EXR69_04085 [Myxococcales bacterium]|nr:hypothetical protein [Myxococcales bacterium]
MTRQPAAQRRLPWLCRLVLGVALAAGVCGLPGAIHDASAADEKVLSKVQLTVLVVHATDSESGVDPRLASLASSFRYFKYSGFRLLSQQTADLTVNGTSTIVVEGGRKLKVTLGSLDSARAKLHVEMSNDQGKVLDTTVNINRDGTFIISGPRYKDGILMLPLRASY